MKRCLSILVAVLFGLSTFELQAQTPASADPAPAKTTSKAPGAAIAQQISLLTGIAITPLLGTSGYGFYKWWNTPAEQRPNLPWFAQWWFWTTGFVIVGLCFIKDTAGNALPTAMKKPFDVIEALENKVSGLLATGALVPFMIMIHPETKAVPEAMLSGLGFATADFTWLYNIFIVPIAMLAFFFVFLASNAINVLILLSPFTTVDAALKGFRLVLLGTVAGTALANPWVGAAWALVIIVVSYFLAGWSFRLSHFGTVYMWDFFTFRSKRFKLNPALNRMFLGRCINKVPARTYGTLGRDEKGQLVFRYRPWLILPPRFTHLPEGQYAAGRGLVNSEIIELKGDTNRTTMLLPPRYRNHEEELVRVYQLTDVRPIGLRKAVRWIREFFVGKEQPVAAA